WNTTEADYPKDQCVHQLFEAQAHRTPDAVALVFEEQSLTYAELNIRANRLAHHLIARGVRPDDRVALLMERSPALVVVILAILKAGAAYVPLHNEQPSARHARIMADAGVQLLLIDGTAEAIAAEPILVLSLDAINAEGLPEHDPGLPVFSQQLAYVMFTSGSTGVPKGVAVTHSNIVSLAADSCWRNGTHERVLFHSPHAFDASTYELWVPLLHGGQVVVAPPVRLEVPSLADLIERHSVSGIFLTTALFNLLAEEQPTCFRGVGEVWTGGEAVSSLAMERVRLACPRTRIVHVYGPTETTTFACFYKVPPTERLEGTVPIGKPMEGMRAYVLDAGLQPSPVGVPGELYLAGTGLAQGYLGLPGLTSERFVADPFAALFADGGARMYRTGDLARWLPDGNLEFLGRVDFQVKIRGFRIEPGEIEAALRGCDGIRDAVVLAREDSPGEKRLVAYVTAYAVAGSADTVAGDVDAAGLPAVLKAHLQSSLPEYMVPAAFVVLESFPLTPNGKLDRKALPAPEVDAYATGVYAPPAGPVEEALAALWGELLGIERVGRHDDFFALGGHSLLAVQVISRLRSSLGLEVSLAELFARPVLAEFAAGLADADATDGGPIPPADRSQPLPLSFAQQRLWFLAQLEGPSATYNIPLAWRLAGELDHGALRGALDQLVVRHEALRTTFVAVDGEPVQRIVPATDARFALIKHDLRDTADVEAELARWLEKEAAESFDLEAGPLLRGRLLRLADREHALLLTLHHAIADGWSLGVLGRELGALYGAMRQGNDDPLPPLPIQYPDYALWERQWVEGALLQRQAAYWQSALAGAPVLLELPTDRPRPPEQDYVGAMLPVLLDAELTSKLKALARRHGATLFQVLLAGFAALLSRLSGQTEVVIGSPSAHRSRTELEGLIGFFVNTLALRIDTGAASVGELIARAKGQTLAAQAHEDLPFEQVVELLQPPRSRAHAPLFQAMFAWQNTPEASFSLSDLAAEALEAPYGVAKFDLTLSLAETGEGIEGGLEYATALFDQATVERWAGHWRTLLAGLAEASDATAVGSLPLLSNAELRQVLVEWNATEAEYPKDQCLHQLFEAQAERTPEAIALVFEEQSLTYAQLNARANQLAHHLIALGIRPDDRVAIGVERSLEMVVGLLAILKAGGAYVPLDPAYPEERLAFMLDDSAPVALLMHGATRERLEALAGAVPMVDLEADGPDWAERSATNPEPAALGLGPNHLAYVIYTSGSTGRPKGVMVEHRQVSRLFVATSDWFRFGPEDVWTLFHSYAFDFSVWELWGALSCGGRLVIVSWAVSRSPSEFYQLLCREGVTVLNQTPSAFQSLSSIQAESLERHRLRYVIFGGEKLEMATLKPWFRQNPERMTRLVNMYGITETTVHVTYRPLVAADADLLASPIGVRLPDLHVYLLDGDGQPVPIGVAGEIHIGGAGVARGYLNRPELTAERFLPDPYAAEPEARMYRTGDLARWLPDGNLEFLGRVDFQVKIRGFRIEPGEIETALRACDGIREAVVLAREHAPGEKRLVAYVTADLAANTADTAGLPAVLKAHLRSSLPEYMVPAAFVVLESLPLTPNGKLDRKALPAPEVDAYATGVYAPPEGPVEESLAALWSELLGIERVGRHDD
ncbi:MAG: amino acid adenylation domain-containing protein, partial [Cyanobacteriota bacterium]